MKLLVVIAISGLPGAGTSAVARELARKLGIDYLSPGEMFKKKSKKKTQINAALEVWSNEGKEKPFHEYLDEFQIERARHGNVVICGKLSVYVLKALADLKVWIDCSLDERARRSARRDKVTFEEARQLLNQREHIESAEWKTIYGVDRESQREIADLVIDSTGLSVDQTVERIISAIPS